MSNVIADFLAAAQANPDTDWQAVYDRAAELGISSADIAAATGLNDMQVQNLSYGVDPYTPIQTTQSPEEQANAYGNLVGASNYAASIPSVTAPGTSQFYQGVQQYLLPQMTSEQRTFFEQQFKAAQVDPQRWSMGELGQDSVRSWTPGGSMMQGWTPGNIYDQDGNSTGVNSNEVLDSYAFDAANKAFMDKYGLDLRAGDIRSATYGPDGTYTTFANGQAIIPQSGTQAQPTSSSGSAGNYAPANYMASMYGRQQTQSPAPPAYTRPEIERLSDADYDKLQNDLVTGYTAPLQRYETLAKQAADEDLARRGIWSSGIATRAQGDIAERMAPQYAQLGAMATDKRYALEQNDINSYNQLNQGYYNTDVQNTTANKQIDTSYDLGLRNNALGYYTADNQYDLGLRSAATNQYQAETGRQQTANNYALGQGQLDLGYLTQNDNYALQQAQLANTAAAQQAQAAWQAQWDPATYLAGLWNGTGGVISSGTGSNFSI